MRNTQRKGEKVYMTEELLFNEIIKRQYLNTIAHEDTKENVSYTFKKTCQTEKMYGKDIFDMNINELSDIMWAFEPSSTNSAYNCLHKLQQYIDWASVSGYRQTNINPFSFIENKRKWASQFVAVRKKSLFSREEILHMCTQLVNFPDKALLLALFEGISGYDFSELLNLRLTDLNQNNGVFSANLYDGQSGKRQIFISETLFEYLHETANTSIYYNKNGMSTSRRSSSSRFVETPSIFKKLARGNVENELDGFHVRRKIILFRKVFQSDYLTAKDIINSGVSAMIHDIYQNSGPLSEEKWVTVAEHYNTTHLTSNGNKRRDTLSLKRIIHEDLFIEKYGHIRIDTNTPS